MRYCFRLALQLPMITLMKRYKKFFVAQTPIFPDLPHRAWYAARAFHHRQALVMSGISYLVSAIRQVNPQQLDSETFHANISSMMPAFLR